MAPLAALLIAPIASSLINSVSGKGVMRGGKKTRRSISLIFSIVLNEGNSWKEALRAEREYNNMGKISYSRFIFYAILSISITSLGLIVFFQEIIYLE